MKDLLREQLIRIVQEYGVDILKDTGKVKGLLKDFCPEEPRGKIFAITQCLREGIHRELIDSSKRKTIRIELSRLIRKIHDNFGLKEDISRWAVETIALALGIISEKETVITTERSQVIEQKRVETHKVISHERIVEERGKRTTNGDELIYVERGSFIMGDTWGDGFPYEKPTHKVTLTYDFHIGKYPVTFEEYDKYCMRTSAKRPGDFSWGRGRRPVINVSWWDAISYCNWLSEKEGIPKAYDDKGNILDKYGKTTTDITEVVGYRLPTEAEWEYAARGGNKSKGYKYSGSDNADDVAWCYQNSGDELHEVGTKLPNELGLHDMSGNTWEWCSDWDDSYSSSPQTNPVDCRPGQYRVTRGGSWDDTSIDVRISCRDGGITADKHDVVGFRICRTNTPTNLGVEVDVSSLGLESPSSALSEAVEVMRDNSAGRDENKGPANVESQSEGNTAQNPSIEVVESLDDKTLSANSMEGDPIGANQSLSIENISTSYDKSTKEKVLRTTNGDELIYV
ncbi:formylglycine-generating enzyme family protein, partial [Mesotoga prima]|uniref:formylglycine-generating enzyme family protein n=1 Tax=Mesotoga prima TaxID=1184387 RepID=UPI002C54F581